MRALGTVLCLAALGVLPISACNSVNLQGPADGGAQEVSTVGDPDGGSMRPEFTAFVKDLIENHTDDPSPATLDDKSFSDSEDPNAFPASFFP